jgi:hypothetical protein
VQDLAVLVLGQAVEESFDLVELLLSSDLVPAPELFWEQDEQGLAGTLT